MIKQMCTLADKPAMPTSANGPSNAAFKPASSPAAKQEQPRLVTVNEKAPLVKSASNSELVEKDVVQDFWTLTGDDELVTET